MSDKSWGFDKCYAHRTLPAAWSVSTGYTLFPASPLSRKTFLRAQGFGVPSLPRSGERYMDRLQDAQQCQSVYGPHRNMPWVDSLRHDIKPQKRKPKLVSKNFDSCSTHCGSSKYQSEGKRSFLQKLHEKSSLGSKGGSAKNAPKLLPIVP
eukprot:GEMP01054713.1.p1 GENE.GEMP01054713.1~~GEMP01054713.1.p1  ORF type:complete len:151 (+),score=20.33 GEMP01054713.1:48-500(+)